MSGSLYVLDTLHKHGKKKALLASLGLALTHFIWAFLAVFALHFIFEQIKEHRTIYTFVGSILLIYFAIKTFHKKRKRLFFLRFPIKNYKVFLESLSLGLSSPLKIVGYAIFFATLGMSQTDPHFFRKAPLLCGTFLGSFLFWFFFVMKMKASLTHSKTSFLKHTHKIAGCLMLLIACFGLVMGFIGIYEGDKFPRLPKEAFIKQSL